MSVGHLIHVGYPKTGSNFLRHWFAAHPEIGFHRRGLAGFANVYDIARQSAGERRVRCRVTSAEALSTPNSSVGQRRIDHHGQDSPPMREAQGRVCATLASLFPSASILIVTRGFRASILSTYSQYVRTGGTEPFASFFASFPSAESWDYDHLIGLYREAFPDRVIVLPYELLRDDPAAFTGELSRRLGVTPHVPPAGRPNTSLSPVELAWYPRLTRLVGSLPIGHWLRRRIEERYLRRARRKGLGPLIALLQRSWPLPPVTDAVLTDDIAAGARGKAEILRDDPLFRPYVAEYFH